MSHEHHGHENDQGIRGLLRYLRWLPQMWSSEINHAVVDIVDPKPGEQVVDIGAGLGAGSMRLAVAGATAIAIEPTPSLRRILAVRKRLSRRGSSIVIVDGSAEAMPVDDGSADAVMAVNTMHHWVDVDAGVAEIVRVLKPGGRMLLVDEAFTDPSHPDHDTFGGEHDLEHHGFTMVDAAEMLDRFASAGLVGATAIDRLIAGRPVIGVEFQVVSHTT